MWRTVAWLPHRTDLRIRSWASFPRRRRASSMPVPFVRTNVGGRSRPHRRTRSSRVSLSFPSVFGQRRPRARAFLSERASSIPSSPPSPFDLPPLSSPSFRATRRDATRGAMRCVHPSVPSRFGSSRFRTALVLGTLVGCEPRSSRHAPVRGRAWAWASGWASRAWWRRRHGRRLLRLRFPRERPERRWALPRTASWWILAGPRTPIGRSWSFVWRAEARRSDGGKRAEWRWTRHGHVVNSKVNSSGTGASESFPLFVAWNGGEGWI